MSKNLDQEVVEIYDNILSKLDHVSSLQINLDNFRQVLDNLALVGGKFDQEVERQHTHFIGEVLMTSKNTNLMDTKRYITFPNFSVITYMPNPEYFYKDNFSLQKCVIIGKKLELNFVLTKLSSNNINQFKFLQILNIQRIQLSPGLSYFKLAIKTIPCRLFYEFYSNLIRVSKTKPASDDNDTKRLKNKAVRDTLNMIGDDPKSIAEGEFVLNDTDYNLFKSFIEKRYGIKYDDTFKSVNGKEESMWNNLGYVRFDNRKLVNVNGKEEILPLSVQKSLTKKSN